MTASARSAPAMHPWYGCGMLWYGQAGRRAPRWSVGERDQCGRPRPQPWHGPQGGRPPLWRRGVHPPSGAHELAIRWVQLNHRHHLQLADGSPPIISVAARRAERFPTPPRPVAAYLVRPLRITLIRYWWRSSRAGFGASLPHRVVWTTGCRAHCLGPRLRAASGRMLWAAGVQFFENAGAQADIGIVFVSDGAGSHAGLI
jgi:hypothetical protein